ncbi:hypothetical protein N9N67_12580 [Bacteriovoracaceae bacterium]|nr:hypothetical protein [Bacteriovoracaceae bacterium]
MSGDPEDFYLKISNKRYEHFGGGHRTFDLLLCSKEAGCEEECVYVNPMNLSEHTNRWHPQGINSFELEDIQAKLKKNKWWWYGIGSMGGMIVGKFVLTVGAVNAGYMGLLSRFRNAITLGKGSRFVRILKTKLFKNLTKLMANEWLAHYALLSRTASYLGIFSVPHIPKVRKYVVSLFSPTTKEPGMMVVPIVNSPDQRNYSDTCEETYVCPYDKPKYNESVQGVINTWEQFTKEADIEMVFEGSKVFNEFIKHFEKFKWDGRGEWKIYHHQLGFQMDKKPSKQMSMVDYAFFLESLLKIYMPVR